MQKFIPSFMSMSIEGSLGVMSSSVGIGWCSRLMALFRSFGSKQILRLPLGFSLMTSEFTQSEWPSTGAMMPCLTISSNSFSSLPYKDKAILWGACTTSLKYLSTLMWYSKSLNLPIPVKHSGYISFSASLFLIGGLACSSLSGWM